MRRSRTSTSRPGSSSAARGPRARVASRRPRTAGLAAEYLRRWGDAVFAVQPRLAETLYGRGLAIAAAEPDALADDQLARLLIGQAEGLGELGRHQEAIAVAERALDLAMPAGQTDTLGFALLALGRSRSNLGQVAVARDLIERALAIFAATGNDLGTARAFHRLAEAQRFDDFPGELAVVPPRLPALRPRPAGARAGRGRPRLPDDGGWRARGRTWLTRATRLVAQSGDERGVASLRRAAAYDAWYRGDLDAAMRAARDARPQAAETGDRWVEVDTPAHRGPGPLGRQGRRPRPSAWSPSSCGSPTRSALATFGRLPLPPALDPRCASAGHVRRRGGWRPLVGS